MYKAILSTFLLSALTLVLHAEANSTSKTNVENNASAAQSKPDANMTKSEKEKRIQKQIEAQMEKEKKYAKEKTFYQGPEYDLSAYEIDPKSLDHIEAVEPDYDFNMDDVYD